MQLDFDLMNARHVQGKKDLTKTYTIIEGVITLPNGMRSFCEAFLNERKEFRAGPHRVELEIGVNRERRIEARITSCVPAVAARPAAAA